MLLIYINFGISSPSSSHKPKIGPIVGGVIGGLGLVALIILFLLYRRRKRTRTPTRDLSSSSLKESAADRTAVPNESPHLLTLQNLPPHTVVPFNALPSSDRSLREKYIRQDSASDMTSPSPSQPALSPSLLSASPGTGRPAEMGAISEMMSTVDTLDPSASHEALAENARLRAEVQWLRDQAGSDYGSTATHELPPYPWSETSSTAPSSAYR